MMAWIAKASPRLKARIAGVFYLITFVAGVFALVSANGRLVANLIATVCYIAVTLLFYDLFKPVSRNISLLAAFLPPYNLAPGIFGEGVLTLWLLAIGVNEQRWNEQANASAIREHK
jgi:hypothetical protein